MTAKPKSTASLASGAKPGASPTTPGPITLCIDIGGSGLKAMLLDAKGKPVSERQRIVTPVPATPRAVLAGLDKLRKLIEGKFDRVSVGFPGVVKHGVVYTGFNLHALWSKQIPLAAELKKRWKKPVRVANDACVAGYGAIKGHGIEMVLTLGTGLGAALFINGHLLPCLELSHHPWRKKTYEDYIGRRGLDQFGKRAWNKYLQEAITQTENLFCWDHLYLGGGNTKKINFPLAKNISIVPNEKGILGGVYLWRDEE
jgi:polyphosphate glucokinase